MLIGNGLHEAHTGSSSDKKRGQFVTIITSCNYADGVIALAQSLHLVRSQYPLLCLVPNEEVAAAIRCLAVPVLNLEVRCCDPGDDGMQKLSTVPAATISGAHISVDAYRRLLWRDFRGFVYVDADMIAVRNCDGLVDLLLNELGREQPDQPAMYATPNFRLKKKMFPTSNAGFFNGKRLSESGHCAVLVFAVLYSSLACCTCLCSFVFLMFSLLHIPDRAAGVMVVPFSASYYADYSLLQDAIATMVMSCFWHYDLRSVQPSVYAHRQYLRSLSLLQDTDTDTEEIVLNRVFKGRWALLPPSLNLQKRCFVHAPELWNRLRGDAVLVWCYGAMMLCWYGAMLVWCYDAMMRCCECCATMRLLLLLTTSSQYRCRSLVSTGALCGGKAMATPTTRRWGTRWRR
jgi:hypothetical protein